MLRPNDGDAGDQDIGEPTLRLGEDRKHDQRNREAGRRTSKHRLYPLRVLVRGSFIPPPGSRAAARCR